MENVEKEEIKRKTKYYIADNLNQLFAITGTKAKELAIALDVDECTISRWRSGIQKPHITYIYMVAKLFNIDPSWLITKNGMTNYPGHIMTNDIKNNNIVSRIHEIFQDKSYKVIGYESGAYIVISKPNNEVLKIEDEQQLFLLFWDDFTYHKVEQFYNQSLLIDDAFWLYKRIWNKRRESIPKRNAFFKRRVYKLYF